MKIIECLSEFIHEEIDDAEKYAKKALEVRETYPDVAELMITLSNEEMKHMQMIHNQVVKMIDGYRKTVGEPPTNMMAVYDYLHKKAIAEAKEVKLLQQMYTEK